MAQKFPNLKLEDLELKHTLGTGSFGRVRLVKHIPTGGAYALKIIKKYETLKFKQVGHILAEKAILAEVNHANLVNSVGSFQDDKYLYILMEFVVGGEFFTHLRAINRFSNEVARFYAAQVILAFEYLHSKDIIYRDLKPENLLLDARGHCKVTDFGFAKKIDYKTWTLCGTPEYLAPEIILSKGHNKGVDWWALGILIYEMLAGYPPFSDDDPVYIYQKILEGQLRFPWHFPKAAKDIIRKLLQHDLTKRLGCMKNGPEDIKRHKWFKEIDWAQLAAQSGDYAKGPIPIAQSHPFDTKNFDPFPESVQGAKAIPEKDQALFKDF